MDRHAPATASREVRSLLEVIPDGVLVLDGRNTVVAANKAAERIFGRRPAGLKGRRLSTLLGRTGNRSAPHHAPAVARRGVELRSIRRADATTRQIELRTQRVARTSNRLCFVRDVTDETRRRVEHERKSVLFDEAVSVARIGAWHLDTTREVLTWSPELRRMMGVSPRKANMSISESYDFYTPISRAIVKEAWDLAIAHGTSYDLELEAVTAQGRHFWVRELCRTRMSHGRLVSAVGISQDITERRKLTQMLADVADKERIRLGADLHDGVCQELTGLSMLLDCYAKADGVTQPIATMLRELAVISRNVSTNAKALAEGMLPVDLHRGGLRAALIRFANSTMKASEVTVAVHIAPEVEQAIDQRIGQQLFRIAQEAVSNAVRHGKARAVTIDVAATRGKSVLTVVDNGVGIIRNSKSSGLGLRTMAYRARILGGLLAIRRLPRRGTRVRCVVPTIPAVRRAARSGKHR